MDSATTDRLLELSRDLSLATGLEHLAQLAATAGAAVLPARCVLVQLYHPGGSVERYAGLELGPNLRHADLSSEGCSRGKIVLDGGQLTTREHGILHELACLLVTAADRVRQQQELTESLLSALSVTAGMACEGDEEGVRHVRRRAAYGRMIGASAGMEDAADLDQLEAIACLMDLGRSSLPAELRSQDSRPNPAELALLAEHEGRAAEVLRTALSAPLMVRAAQVAVQVNQAYGRHGETLLIEARVLAVARAFEALTRCAPRGDGLSAREALQQLAQEAGTRFDPQVLEACSTCLECLDTERCKVIPSQMAPLTPLTPLASDSLPTPV